MVCLHMRPLILKMDMSIDGFVGQPDEKPAWPVDYYNEESTAYMLDLISSVGVHAMGRGAYEEMAPYWQTSTDVFAKPMNEIPKAVFSRTLTEATWPESTIYRDIESGMAELKAEDGAPIITYGGATFAQELTRRGLVDEYRINVHPIALGTGYRLFGGPVRLKLQDVRRFATGSVSYTYIPG
jgi:dihydrofolate reductase